MPTTSNSAAGGPVEPGVSAPATSGPDAWDPQVYERFKAEREQPGLDLAELLRPSANRAAGGAVRSVDLGCGTGALTRRLHRHLTAGWPGGEVTTIGIDNSPAMLAEATGHAGDGVSFELGDLATFERPGELDVVYSNAALHWVGDHADVLARWRRSLRAGGQLAVQVPANDRHPAHRLVAEVLAEPAFAGFDVAADPVSLNVLAPEAYAVLLDELGFADQQVRLSVYVHRLPSSADVAAWTAGSTLTRVRSALPADAYEAFFARYRDRVVEVLGDRRPFLYTFNRILVWGRLPG